LKKILVIDCEDEVRSMIKTHLEQRGFEVETASNNIDGVQKFYLLSPDVLLLDISLPKEQGLEIIIDVKKFYQKKKIIAMSTFEDGITNKSLLCIANEFGADMMLEKPFDAISIINAVNQVLGSLES